MDLAPQAAALQMATTFCSEKWAVLGLTKEDADNPTVIEDKCVVPLTNAFLERIGVKPGMTA